MPNVRPTPTNKLPITPLIGDVLLVEVVDTKVAGNANYPAFGTPHPRTVQWPNHKFCWAESGEAGVQSWYYVADRETQHLYNWEQDNSRDWPVIRQTFLIPREEYEAGGVTYTAPVLPDIGDYSITSITQSRSDFAKLDNLYVVVQVAREDITQVQEGVEFDMDVGELRAYSRQKVAAGTPGDYDPETGAYTEVQPINPFWSISTTRQAAGLAGSREEAGVSPLRTYPTIVEYSWPGVLSPISPFSTFYPPLQGGGYGRAITTHNYLRKPYSGPCVGLVLEQWTEDAPTVDITGAAMTPEEIRWSGRLLDLYIPPSLHVGVNVFETSGTDHPDYAYYYFSQYYPSTAPTDWPEYVDTNLSIRPVFGGYLSRKIRIYNPYIAQLSTTVLLSVIDVTETTALLLWASGIPGSQAALIFYREVGGGSWIAMNGGAAAAAPNFSATGLTAETDYEFKVSVQGIESNVATATTPVAA